MRRYCVSLVMAALIMALFVVPAFSQENKEQAAPAATGAAQAPDSMVTGEAVQPQELSIYGEVQNTDTAAGSLSIQYYDYDNDEEKTADVIVNKDTKIDNAAALGDIKKGDWADVTYNVIDGKNVAKAIMVEKEEEPSTPAAPGATTAEPAGEE